MYRPDAVIIFLLKSRLIVKTTTRETHPKNISGMANQEDTAQNRFY